MGDREKEEAESDEPEDAAEEPAVGVVTTVEGIDEPMGDCPWMAPEEGRAIDAGGAWFPEEPGAADDSEGEQSSGWDVGDESDRDEHLEDAFAELEAARARWAAEEDRPVADDFTGGLLGGRWTKKKTGHGADNVIYEATSTSAKEWYLLYGLKESKRASIKGHTMEVASTICRSWAHRMQYYLDTYRTSGDDMYVYTQEDHDAYTPPADFRALAATATGLSLRAVREIERLLPSRPVV